MKEQLSQILSAALAEVEHASSKAELEAARVKYLGKKGELTAILRGMGKLSAEERPVIGQLANEVRAKIEEAIEREQAELAQRLIAHKLQTETIDVTLPGQKLPLGKRHPLNTVLYELYDIFTGMGFSIAEGPEVELDYYNFEALNIPKNHPARDTQDTFYINDNIVLRTQTSPMQIRTMEKQKPPIRVIAPGRVYRSDAVDATHSPVFHQIEGLVVDKGITMGDLKGTLEVFAKRLYGEEARVRFRPHHFPFTEPSAEMDVTCFKCHGAGLPRCAKGRAGSRFWAAAWCTPRCSRSAASTRRNIPALPLASGLERIVMQRYRHRRSCACLYENDLRFLTQF